MEEISFNQKQCPFCDNIMSSEIFNDHLMCHQIENEENVNPPILNINPNNNSNHESNNNNDYNSFFSNSNYQFNNAQNNNENNQINNNENNQNNNQNGILSKIYNFFSSPFQSQNNNPNINNNNNNNNSNNNDPGFFNSFIGRNPYRNNDEMNNNINNHRDNNIPPPEQETNVLDTISNAFNNLKNNPIVRNVLLDNNPLRIMRNIESYNLNNNNNYNINSHIPYGPVNGEFYQNNRDHRVIIMPPPIIIGERGHVLDINNYRNNYGNNYGNNNNISSDDLNKIMELLPLTVLSENKEGENNECVVCLSSFEAGETITTLPCLHIFHTDCIKSWLESHNCCPICKYVITLESIMRDN